MPKIYGQLERAQLEVLASNPGAGTTGRIWWNSTDNKTNLDDGTLIRAILRNDQYAVVGNNGTANNNIRLHRGASGVLQFVTGGDTTAEGTLSTTLNQISGRLENYTDAGKPTFGNAGRAIWVTDTSNLQIDTGAAWQSMLTNPMDSAGDMIIGGASGAPTKLDHPGTDNRVVRSTGASSTGFGQVDNPAFFTTGAAASNTDIGILTTAAQNIAGVKTFYDGVKFDDAGGQSTLNYFVDSGSFTPTLEADVTNPSSVTYSNQVGRYVRIGNTVFVTARLHWTNASGGDGSLLIADLPFTPVNTASVFWTGSVLVDNIDYPGATTDHHVQVLISPNSTKIKFQSAKDASSPQTITINSNQGAASRQIIMNCWFQIA